MKRLFCLLLAAVLCAMAYFPVTASAAKYAVSGTDMTVELDDSQWYVFTRDNVKDNPELEEFGLTEEDMVAFPYGKNVKDGAIAVEGDMSDLYG